MTGGQMAPTTLLGEKTTTTPLGRDPAVHGYPLKVCELLATLDAPVFLERVALGSNKQIMATGRALRHALENQVHGLGFSLVEVLSPCPTIWGLDPAEAQAFVRETMTRTFPLGNFRDRSASAVPQRLAATVPDLGELPRILGLGPASGADGASDTVAPASPVPTADHRIVVAGFGGQGVLLLGEFLAEAGLSAGYHVSWLPSYGPQMRSGTSNCHVRISAVPIDSPVVSRPNVLIALNEPSLRKFLLSMEPGGLVLYNADRVPVDCAGNGVRITPIASTAIADGLGSAKVGNMVMLGALLEATGLLPDSALDRALHRLVTRESWYELDRAALQAGRAAVRRMTAAPAEPSLARDPAVG
jgi:2-oxoisovalerate ferredoxin oxidoreductase beta subunit